MDEEEALEEMHFLVMKSSSCFQLENKLKLNVLYKRRDGTYGLIDPILG